MFLLFIAGAAAVYAQVDAYVMTLGDTTHIRSGGDLNLKAVLRIAKRFDGDFLWVRTGGRAYVIRDERTLEAIARLFAPMEALHVEQQALNARMQPLERRERDIDRLIEQWEDRDDARVRELEGELRGIERKLHALEQEESALDLREEQLEREAERKMVPVVDLAIREGTAQRQ